MDRSKKTLRLENLDSLFTRPFDDEYTDSHGSRIVKQPSGLTRKPKVKAVDEVDGGGHSQSEIEPDDTRVTVMEQSGMLAPQFGVRLMPTDALVLVPS